MNISASPIIEDWKVPNPQVVYWILKGEMALADGEPVAQAQAIGARSAAGYAPAYWGLIMAILRNLPRIIFNRLPL
jgi:hypothetical protein